MEREKMNEIIESITGNNLINTNSPSHWNSMEVGKYSKIRFKDGRERNKDMSEIWKLLTSKIGK